jgi:hypothetical protein
VEGAQKGGITPASDIHKVEVQTRILGGPGLRVALPGRLKKALDSFFQEVS